MTDWQTTETLPPDGAVVMTKIDDAAHGCRNEGALYRSGSLWFVPDGSMYVYYRPTHWRELTPSERVREAGAIVRKMNADRSANECALGRVTGKPYGE